MLSKERAGNYLVVTPCRNEQDYVQKTIDSMVTQTIRPSTWIIVDDGSTDRTPEILEKARQQHDFIKIVSLSDRGKRDVGPGVVNSFYEGLNGIVIDDYTYICKLDADLSFDPVYFETLISYMEKFPRLGNISGKTYIKSGKEWVSERMGDENAIGASKFYRTECFKEIGGFVRHAGWDGIDGHMCRMNDWIALSIDRENLIMHHYRPQGSSQESIWIGRKRWGRGKYFMGSSLIYVAAASLFRMFEYPFIVGGVGIMYGYILGSLQRTERIRDKAYLSFFRKYEFHSLFFGKKKTLRKHIARIVNKYNLDESILEYDCPEYRAS